MKILSWEDQTLVFHDYCHLCWKSNENLIFDRRIYLWLNECHWHLLINTKEKELVVNKIIALTSLLCANLPEVVFNN